MANDPVDHPVHYTSDPSGVECITVTRHRNFNVGNAIKYLWRAGLKKPDPATVSGAAISMMKAEREKQIEDLKKARWYIADEIKRLGGEP